MMGVLWLAKQRAARALRRAAARSAAWRCPVPICHCAPTHLTQLPTRLLPPIGLARSPSPPRAWKLTAIVAWGGGRGRG